MPRVCPKRIWPYEADVNRTLLGESLPRFSLRWPAHSVGEAVALFFMGLRGIEWANLGAEGARKLCIS
jgi:hypothetical protein